MGKSAMEASIIDVNGWSWSRNFPMMMLPRDCVEVNNTFEEGDRTSPSESFVEVRALNVANALVNGERHSIARNGRVVNDVWVGEFLVHHVQGVDDLYRKKGLAAKSGEGNGD
jgi:hypothetical protein